MGKLNLLHHKSWHVYSQDNVARVKRDEAKARGEEEEVDRRLMLADSEARLERMRKKTKKERDGQGAGEKELERQLKGLGPPVEQEAGGTMIVRPEGWKGKGKEIAGPTSMEGKHINFWSEFEAGAKTTLDNPEVLLEKAKEKEHFEGLTKVYLAKKGEGEPTGWYATPDGKTERERKEPIEMTLERAYKDGEHKRLSDPLALMNSFLQRRSEVLSGTHRSRATSSTGRERYPTPSTTPLTERGDLSPVITTLLAPKRRRGDPIPPPPPPPSSMPPPRPSSSKNPVAEASSRVSSERARAAALIAAAAAKKRGPSESVASETPRSDTGGWGMYNKEETREAREMRMWGKRGRDDGDTHSRGWGEQKRRRDDRERSGWGGKRDWGH